MYSLVVQAGIIVYVQAHSLAYIWGAVQSALSSALYLMLHVQCVEGSCLQLEHWTLSG